MLANSNTNLVVAKAFDVLTDDDKKAAYERYGAEGPQIQQSRGHSHNRAYYNDDINPEDIFNMFFGGMPPGKKTIDVHVLIYNV